MIPRPSNPLIVALDVSDLDEADRLAEILAPHVAMVKVGLELFWARGPEAVRILGVRTPIFVDAKLHDIPTTVSRAARNIARLGAAMVTVHACGGVEMMRAALEGAKHGAAEAGHRPPLVIAVTVLSSRSVEEPASPVALASEARAAGLHGVVVSGEDVEEVRAVCGDAACLVVPGIRQLGSVNDDHRRVLTPAVAMERGADYLVVGRPIIGSRDPVGAARGIQPAAR